MGSAFWAEQDQWCAAFFGGQLQSAQGAHIGVGQPQQDHLAAARVERLAGCPAGMGRALGLDDEQASEWYAGGGEGWRIGQAGRSDAGRPAPYRHAGEQGEQQPQLTDSIAGQQQFAQCGEGPSASGQGRVQCRVAGRSPRQGRRGQSIAAPDKVVQG